jgi:hypothetical protein
LDDDYYYNEGAVVQWTSEAGAEYYVQVVGGVPAEFGTYTLTVTSFDGINAVGASGTY